MRAAAVKAYSKFYEDNEPRLEQIWDELIRIRNQMGKNLGYKITFLSVIWSRDARITAKKRSRLSASRYAPFLFRCEEAL